MYVYTIYTSPPSVQAQYSRSCPIISSSCYNGSLITWTVLCLTAAKFKPLIFLNCTASFLQDNSSAWTTQETQLLYCCRGVFAAPLRSNFRGADYIESIVLLLLLACMLRALPSNGRCLQSHYLAKGLYATIWWEVITIYMGWVCIVFSVSCTEYYKFSKIMTFS
jgi:hypothetical protein